MAGPGFSKLNIDSKCVEENDDGRKSELLK